MTGGAYPKTRITLTFQELRIVRYLAEGLTDKRIAQILDVSVHVVMNRIQTMRQNHHALNRTHLVSIMYRKGVLR